MSEKMRAEQAFGVIRDYEQDNLFTRQQYADDRNIHWFNDKLVSDFGWDNIIELPTGEFRLKTQEEGFNIKTTPSYRMQELQEQKENEYYQRSIRGPGITSGPGVTSGPGYTTGPGVTQGPGVVGGPRTSSELPVGNQYYQSYYDQMQGGILPAPSHMRKQELEHGALPYGNDLLLKLFGKQKMIK